MTYRELGKSGIEVSAVAMGTWAIGGSWWGGTNEQDSIAAIQRGLDEGITMIDTAPAYGLGLSEELVGRAIKGRDREKIIVATKVGLVWDDRERIERNLKPASVQQEIEDSLRRLQTDYVDLYQTHWQDEDTPIPDTMEVLLRLQEEGKIRAIGVSNCSVPQMEEYLALGRIESNQPPYSMLRRDIEDELLPFCPETGIAILAYSPLAKGLLTGNMDPDREFNEGDQRRDNPQYAPENIRKMNAMLEKFAPIRERYGLTQTQLTIAWTISRPGVTVALTGVRNEEQAATAARAGVELSEEDLAEMDEILEKELG